MSSVDDTAAGGRPTLRDVAREAGLSVTQTSRALNGHADVAEATRERAVDAARRVGYVPNLEARRLRNPDTPSGSIGLVLDTTSQRLNDPFLGELLTSLSEGAASHGFELQLSTPVTGRDPVATYERAIRTKRVDGFVVLRATLYDPRIRHLTLSAVPFVTFGRTGGFFQHPAVCEPIDVLWPAIEHLVKLGHRRIGCVSEPLGYAVAANRHSSYVKCVDRAGLDLRPDYVAIAGFREDDGYEATARLLSLENPPTAVVTFNDLLAIGTMQAVADAGLSVPDDLSVVGFDDIYAARYTTPPLTTLRHEDGAIGHKLVDQLVCSMGDGCPNDTEHVSPRLIVRGSTGPAPR